MERARYQRCPLAEEATPKRVLLVDDQLGIRRGYKRVIDAWAMKRSLRVEVTACEDGSEALATFRALAPDLVISDTHMPNMGGLGLLREIRATGSRLPFVLMSGGELSQDEQETCKTLGAEYSPKPIELKVIEGFLERFLPAAPKHVAVVADDDPDACRSLADLLTSLGFEVLEARDGTETLAYCRSRAVSFVISDFQMGDLDGVRCLVKLRQEDRLMPYLVLSGRNDADVIALIEQNGGAYRQKPVNNNAVQAWLRSHAFLPDAS